MASNFSSCVQGIRRAAPSSLSSSTRARPAPTGRAGCSCSRFFALTPGRARDFKILALESSADDTCAAVVDSSRRMLSNVVRKQHEIHRQFGGIHPMYAQHAHIKAMPGVIKEALDAASLSLEAIDAFAFTQGPGMFQSLSVSCVAASTMASTTGKPLIGVNHMQGHALTPLMTEEHPPDFPFLTLLVSGGHTQLIIANTYDEFEILVETGSIPIGNAFDHVATMLQIPPHPTLGLGPALEAFAASSPVPSSLPPSPPPVPLPSLSHSAPSPHFDFGSVLSSLRLALHALSPLPDAPPSAKHAFAPDGLEASARAGLARAFQDEAVIVLEEGIRRVLKKRRRERKGALSSLVVSGGVACNQVIRRRMTALGAAHGMRVMFPPPELCTDNAAMIANAAVHRVEQGRFNAHDDCLPRRKWSIRDVLKPSGEAAGEERAQEEEQRAARARP